MTVCVGGSSMTGWELEELRFFAVLLKPHFTILRRHLCSQIHFLKNKYEFFSIVSISRERLIIEVSASILVLLTLRGHDYMLILRDPRTLKSM